MYTYMYLVNCMFVRVCVVTCDIYICVCVCVHMSIRVISMCIKYEYFNIIIIINYSHIDI